MGHRFDTTNWTLIFQASAGDSVAASAALESLCEAYWYPVYSFIRRQGYPAADAEDLTQGYFTQFLEKHYVRDVHPQGGRFRSFVLASVKHFLANERDRALALKRGGGQRPISLDAQGAEQRYGREPVEPLTPEVVFQRNWASAVLARALARVESEMDATVGKERFRRLRPHLTGDEPRSYEELARELGVSEAAVRVAVHRLRKRYGLVLREEIGRTVEDPREVEEEIRYLLAVVGI